MIGIPEKKKSFIAYFKFKKCGKNGYFHYQNIYHNENV
jgi:hypothetical protein